MSADEQRSGRGTAGRTLSIGALSRATRIPVATLRTWERRYGSPMPVRKPSGHRVYPATAVEQLRRVGRLLSQGHRPADLLGLSIRQLDAMLKLGERAAPGAGAASAGVVAGPSEPAEVVAELMRGTADLDRDRILHGLRSAWARFGPLRFLDEVAGRYMSEVGRAWQERSLEVRHEHFAAACLAGFLRTVREPFDERARGPRVVMAGLEGDAHEGGLLMVATLAAVHGYRTIYLGPSTPVEQIAAAAHSGPAEAVAISVSAACPRARATQAIAKLRQALPARVALWVGGAGAPRSARGAEHFESLALLDARLATPDSPLR